MQPDYYQIRDKAQQSSAVEMGSRFEFWNPVFESELFFSYYDFFCELLAISWDFLWFLGIPWPDAAIHAEVAATHISCDHWLEAAAGCTSDIAQLRYRAIRLPGRPEFAFSPWETSNRIKNSKEIPKKSLHASYPAQDDMKKKAKKRNPT